MNWKPDFTLYYSRPALEHWQKHSESLLGLDLYSAVLMNHFSPLPQHVAPHSLIILYLCVVTVWAKTTDMLELYSFYLTINSTKGATKIQTMLDRSYFLEKFSGTQSMQCILWWARQATTTQMCFSSIECHIHLSRNALQQSSMSGV